MIRLKARGSDMSRTAVVGFSSGIALIVMTLVAVATVSTPHPAGAAVVNGALVNCPLAEVSLDQGYGFGRTALRAVCSRGAEAQLEGVSRSKAE